MANVNIFEKFGVKEVANVYFEALAPEEASGVQEGDIVLFLDTLKVSTVETTAESVDARGGWGNPKLVTWDFGKEITLSLTDALLSFESARLMLGGKLRDSGSTTQDKPVEVHYTAQITVPSGASNNTVKVPSVENPSTKADFPAADLVPKAGTLKFINLTQGFRGTATFAPEGQGGTYTLTPRDGKSTVAANDIIRIFWVVDKYETSEGNRAVEITISPNTFPGTYKIVGDTFMRSEADGKDYPFQFIIGKAKVMSEVTINMEAEGDPSTFDMTISVLRDKNGDMMKWVRYDYVEAAKGTNEGEAGV